MRTPRLPLRLYLASHQLAWALGLLLPALAAARSGGGEHYEAERSQTSSGGGNSGGGDGLLWILYFTLQHPRLMVPLLVLGGIGYLYYQKTRGPTATTQRAFQQREAELRTSV